MGRFRLNIVLHKIVQNKQELKNRYDVTEEFAYDLVKQLQSITSGNLFDLGVFLDDGYASQFAFVLRLVHDYNIQIFIPVISQTIGSDGYMSRKEIDILKQESNIIFCSHGVSHVALGKYENDIVLSTPKGGIYRNMPIGQLSTLTEQEISYQLKESSKQLSSFGIQTDTFVYPYGIYSVDILDVVKQSGVYVKAYTCDDGLELLDVDSLAIPRLLVDNTLSISEWTMKARKILKR